MCLDKKILYITPSVILMMYIFVCKLFCMNVSMFLGIEFNS